MRFLFLTPSFWPQFRCFVPAEPREQIHVSWHLHQGPRICLSRNTQLPETSGRTSTSAKQESENDRLAQ